MIYKWQNAQNKCTFVGTHSLTLVSKYITFLESHDMRFIWNYYNSAYILEHFSIE